VKAESKQIIEAIISNPKLGYFAVFITTLETWWIEWGNPLISAVSSILGVVLLVILILYHFQNLIKLIRENKAK